MSIFLKLISIELSAREDCYAVAQHVQWEKGMTHQAN